MVNNLKNARIASGLSIQEASSITGINSDELINLESGEKRTSTVILCKLAKAYQCSTFDILDKNTFFEPKERSQLHENAVLLTDLYKVSS